MNIDIRFIFAGIAVLATVFAGLFGQALLSNIVYPITKRGRRPASRPLRLWAAFYLSLAATLVGAASTVSGPSGSLFVAVLEPPERPAAMLPFESNFDDKTFTGWEVVAGVWSAESGALGTLIPREFVKSVIQVGSLSWTDYSLELDAMYETGADEEIRVRVGPSGYYHYTFGLHHDLITGGMAFQFGTASQGWFRVIPTTELKPLSWQHIRIDVVGPTVKVLLNGRLLFDYSDPANSAPRGGVQLVGWSGANGRQRSFFDNVRVTPIQP